MAKPTMSATQLIVRAVLAPLMMLSLIFLAAGRLDYLPGWIYMAINVVIMLVMAFLLTKSPELIQERLKPGEGMKSFDRLYFALSTPLYIVALVVAGLDARFGWTGELPRWLYAAGMAIFLVGQAIFLWARYTNAYFSSVVRIQVERGHTVCKEGPYRYVRHPGYVGGFLFTASTGLVLGSLWACLPQFIACALLVWRTRLEDQVLLAELPGYAQYAAGTRYRLLPGVW